MTRVLLATAIVVATASLSAAQQRYLRAEEDQQHDLVVTTSSGQQIVISKDRKLEGDQQVGFRDVAISPDGQAVGWTALFPNCCTSYPIPMLVEVYRAGTRKTFTPAIAPWHWCFVDGSSRIAALSTTVHGPQNEIIELWDIESGKRLEDFTWMEGESYPRAPAWAASVHRSYANASEQGSHFCSTKR